MLKKFISALIILSIIVSDNAWCMKRSSHGQGAEDQGDQSFLSSAVKRLSQSVSAHMPILGKRRSTNSQHDEIRLFMNGDESLNDMSALLQTETYLDPDEGQALQDEVSALLEEQNSALDRDDGAYQSAPHENLDLATLQHLDRVANLNHTVEPASRIIHPPLFGMSLKKIDLENLPNLPPALQSLLTFALELERGDPDQQKTLRYLEHAYDRILKGKLTRKQMIMSGVGALLIALGVSAGIISIFEDSVLGYVISASGKKLSSNLKFFLGLSSDIIQDYAYWIIFTDAVCRNAKTLVQFTAPSLDEFEYEKGKLEKLLGRASDFLLYGCSSLVALLLCYFLYEAQGGYSGLLVGWNSDAIISSVLSVVPTIFVFVAEGLTLFMDDIIYFGSRLSPPFKSFMDHHFFQKKRLTKNPSLEMWRCQVIDEFTDLEEMVREEPEHSVLNLFYPILRPVLISDVPQKSLLDSIKAVEVLKTLQMLRNTYSLHHKEHAEPKSKAVVMGVTKMMEWGFPSIATFGRSVVFWYVLYQTLEDIGINNEATKMVGSILLGGVIASLIQLRFEAQGVHHLLEKLNIVPQLIKYFSQKFKGNPEINQSPSLSLKRRILTGLQTFHDYFAGLWIAIPFIITGYNATEEWRLWLLLVCLTPAAFSGVLGNAMSFQESSQDLREFVKSLDLTTKPNVASQQARKLLEMIDGFKDSLEKLAPSILLNLKGFLDPETIEGKNYPQVEILREDLKFFQVSSTFQNLLSTVLVLEGSEKEEDHKVLRFLIYLQEFLNQDKMTSTQALIGGVTGVLTGIISGQTSSGTIFNIVANLPTPNNDFGSFLTLLINVMQVQIGKISFVPFWPLDGTSRTGKAIAQLVSPSTTDFQESQGKSRKFLDGFEKIVIYGIASLLSLSPIYYFYLSELSIEIEFGKPFILTQVSYTAPFLFLNSLFFYGPRLNHYAEKLMNGVFSLSRKQEMPSFAEHQRQKFLKEFKDLKWWFAGLKDEDVDDVYHHVFNQPFSDSAEKPEAQELAQVAEALRTLWVLRTYHTQNRHMMSEPDLETGRKVFSNVVGWGLPLIASFGRSVIYWYIFYNLFQIIGIPDEAANVFAIGFGGIIGSLAQGSTEVEATKKAVYEWTGGKKIGDDTSQGWARKLVRRLGKTQNIFAAAIQSLPYIAVGITATINWPLWLSLSALIPAGLAETLKNVMWFNQSIGGAAQFVDKMAAKISYPTATQKRNRLVALARNYRKMFKTLHPDILMKLDEMLESVNENGNEFDHSDAGFSPFEPGDYDEEEELNEKQDD